MQTPDDRPDIKGWGIDADPKNDPTYPVKARNNAEHAGYTWERPTQQPFDTDVHHSIERPNISAVFGTAVEPSGVSALLRRIAFSKSENQYGHWLPLLLADRVNVIEGLVDDIRRGHIPNLYSEKGLNADWHYDRKHLLKKAAIGAGAFTLAVLYLKRKH